MSKFDSFNRKLSSRIQHVGIAAFIVMMIVTTLDVLGTKLLLIPVPGALDIMMMAQLIAISFGISATLIAGGHIQVEFFVMLFPKKIQIFVELFSNLLGLVLFALITCHLFKYGCDLKEYNEVSPTIRLPLYPFAMAAAIACIPAFLVYLHGIFRTLYEVIKR